MARAVSVRRGSSSVSSIRRARSVTTLRVGLSVLAIALGLTAALRDLRSEAQNPSSSRANATAAQELAVVEIEIRRVRNELKFNRSAQQQPSTPANRMDQLRQRERQLIQQEASLLAQRGALQNQH